MVKYGVRFHVQLRWVLLYLGVDILAFPVTAFSFRETNPKENAQRTKKVSETWCPSWKSTTRRLQRRDKSSAGGTAKRRPRSSRHRQIACHHYCIWCFCVRDPGRPVRVVGGGLLACVLASVVRFDLINDDIPSFRGAKNSPGLQSWHLRVGCGYESLALRRAWRTYMPVDLWSTNAHTGLRTARVRFERGRYLDG